MTLTVRSGLIVPVRLRERTLAISEAPSLKPAVTVGVTRASGQGRRQCNVVQSRVDS